MGGGTIPGAVPIGPNGISTPNGASGGQDAAAQTPQKTDSSQTADSTSDSQTVSSSGTGSDPTSSDQPVRTFGGMPIVGVASTSKAPTIREFDKKKKYNEWSFLYDPSLDRGQLITTPYQPQLQMFGTGPQNVNGPTQNPTPGLGTSAPGTTAAPSGTFGNPNQPTGTPVQQ
jgi:hypothetical protein